MQKLLLKYINIRKLDKQKKKKKWVNWLNNKEVTKYSCQRLYKHTINSQKKYLKEKMKEKKTLFFQVLFKKNKIGVIVLTKIDHYHKNCEINFLIGEKFFWGKGIATYIIKLIVKYAFSSLKMKKIYTCIYANNLASKKALIKNNFKVEGVLKDFYKFKPNQRVDKIYFGLLKK